MRQSGLYFLVLPSYGGVHFGGPLIYWVPMTKILYQEVATQISGSCIKEVNQLGCSSFWMFSLKLGWSFRWDCFSRYSTFFLRIESSLVYVVWYVFEQIYSDCVAVRLLLPFAQLFPLIIRRINHVLRKCSGEFIPSQADQVAHSGVHRIFMCKGQCDISRFLMGIVNIHLLFPRFSAEILGSRGRTQAVFMDSLF